MQQKELAKLLDISPSMVSRLVGQGMPTDTLDRAKKWRKRHLEPGRIKGSRYDPKHDQAAAAVAPVPSAPAAKPGASMRVLEAEALALNAALINGDQEEATERLAHLRCLFQEVPNDAQPRVPLRVWLALVDYVIHKDYILRNAPNMDEALTPAEFGELPSETEDWFAWRCIELACDWDGYSITGFPDYPDDDAADAAAAAK
jgi:hypothetical protein